MVEQDGRVILEHAVLDVVTGHEQGFEEAFDQAQHLIATMPGFRSLRLERCLENPSRYLLLVEWDRLKDHTEGFRGSAEYQNWRHLLHHFYDPFPTVEHTSHSSDSDPRGGGIQASRRSRAKRPIPSQAAGPEPSGRSRAKPPVLSQATGPEPSRRSGPSGGVRTDCRV
jgi:heme-degrading monooxygenase HmoA